MDNHVQVKTSSNIKSFVQMWFAYAYPYLSVHLEGILILLVLIYQ